jgi:hypothetical protein
VRRSQPLRAADPRFINVACSRAQHLLVVVGNFDCGLASSDDWHYVLSQATENGVCIEHSVTQTFSSSQADVEPDLNIHGGDLKLKLQDLLELKAQVGNDLFSRVLPNEIGSKPLDCHHASAPERFSTMRLQLQGVDARLPAQ